MDISEIRSGITLLGFLLFVGLVARVWRRKAQSSHQTAARLVFEGEADPVVRPMKETQHG